LDYFSYRVKRAYRYTTINLSQPFGILATPDLLPESPNKER
jgi:hypothetical protein